MYLLPVCRAGAHGRSRDERFQACWHGLGLELIVFYPDRPFHNDNVVVLTQPEMFSPSQEVAPPLQLDWRSSNSNGASFAASISSFLNTDQVSSWGLPLRVSRLWLWTESVLVLERDSSYYFFFFFTCGRMYFYSNKIPQN